MTLIEMMIVVGLLALVMGVTIAGSGFFASAEQRATASLLVGAVRKGLAIANQKGLPTRLKIDMSAGRIVLEESSSRQVVVKKLTPEEEEKEILNRTRSEADRVAEGIKQHKPSFLASTALGQDGDEPGRSTGKNVQIRLVQTEHDEEPLTSGVTYLYFWPGGATERAVIQLGRDDSDGLTVTISSLTGRARIEKGRVELPDGRDDDDLSEREEEQ
jgi:general secretion pathway protein H